MEEAEYHKLAGVEDRMWYFLGLHALIAGRLDAALDSQAPAALLDAGCGTGGLIRRVAARRPSWRWTGVDLSRSACAFARKRTVAEIREASIEALPFSDGTFDAIVSADVLYHVDEEAAALREFFRVLRPGGMVVLNVPAFAWLWSYHDVAVEGRRRYTRREVMGRLAAAGFVEPRATYWNTLLFPLVVIRRKCLAPPRGGSDVQLYSPPMEALGRTALALERAWLQVAGRLPFGSSVFAVARKPLVPNDPPAKSLEKRAPLAKSLG